MQMGCDAPGWPRTSRWLNEVRRLLGTVAVLAQRVPALRDRCLAGGIAHAHLLRRRHRRSEAARNSHLAATFIFHSSLY